jgi:hypothetical protein
MTEEPPIMIGPLALIIKKPPPLPEILPALLVELTEGTPAAPELEEKGANP